jgi:hypothetical protein
VASKPGKGRARKLGRASDDGADEEDEEGEEDEEDEEVDGGGEASFMRTR